MMRRHRFAVCAIAKDENPYILEWTAYHLAIGFDHVFIYDNLSRAPLADAFSPASLNTHVTVTTWPYALALDPQQKAYDHFLEAHGATCEWVAVLDLDEFVDLKTDRRIDELILRLGDVDGIAINWRIFGSSGRLTYSEELLCERFQRCSEVDFKPNRHVKTISKLENVVRLTPHHAIYRSPLRLVSPDGREACEGYSVLPRAESLAAAQINHYFVKSREEWDWKLRRGDTKAIVRTEADFQRFDRNELLDDELVKWRELVRTWMKRLRRS